METRHIRLNYEDALLSKKNILNLEIDIFQLLGKLKNYKTLRKKEIAEKNKLKSIFSFLKSKLNLIESTFPEQELKIKKQKEPSQRKTEKIKKDIQEEIEEIRNKLASLER